MVHKCSTCALAEWESEGVMESALLPGTTPIASGANVSRISKTTYCWRTVSMKLAPWDGEGEGDAVGAGDTDGDETPMPHRAI